MHQHPSDLLRSLTHGRDRQGTAWRHLNHALSFAISSDQTLHVLGMSHMMRMRIPSCDYTYLATTVDIHERELHEIGQEHVT